MARVTKLRAGFGPRLEEKGCSCARNATAPPSRFFPASQFLLEHASGFVWSGAQTRVFTSSRVQNIVLSLCAIVEHRVRFPFCLPFFLCCCRPNHPVFDDEDNEESWEDWDDLSRKQQAAARFSAAYAACTCRVPRRAAQARSAAVRPPLLPCAPYCAAQCAPAPQGQPPNTHTHRVAPRLALPQAEELGFDEDSWPVQSHRNPSCSLQRAPLNAAGSCKIAQSRLV